MKEEKKPETIEEVNKEENKITKEENNDKETGTETVTETSFKSLKDTLSTMKTTNCQGGVPVFQCDRCQEKFTNMVWYTKHKTRNDCPLNPIIQDNNKNGQSDVNGQHKNTSDPEIHTEKL